MGRGARVICHVTPLRTLQRGPPRFSHLKNTQKGYWHFFIIRCSSNVFLYSFPIFLALNLFVFRGIWKTTNNSRKNYRVENQKLSHVESHKNMNGPFFVKIGSLGERKICQNQRNILKNTSFQMTLLNRKINHWNASMVFRLYLDPTDFLSLTAKTLKLYQIVPWPWIFKWAQFINSNFRFKSRFPVSPYFIRKSSTNGPIKAWDKLKLTL